MVSLAVNIWCQITEYTLESETAFFADDGRVADFGREAEVGLRGT